MAVQGGGGVLVRGGIQGKTGRGSQCSGLVDTVVFGYSLDSMMSEVFSNPNKSDSVLQ